MERANNTMRRRPRPLKPGANKDRPVASEADHAYGEAGAAAKQTHIIEPKPAEQEQQRIEERFRLVADAAPIMIWMSGSDKLCTYFNPPWLEFTGRSLEAECGNGWSQGVHPDDLRRCLKVFSRSFDRRVPFRMEYRLRRHDGEYRWIEDTGVPILVPDGSFAGYIGSCVDITDRKMAEKILRGTSAMLLEAQEKERRYIAQELHDDINQRLALLSIGLQRLAQKLSSDSAAQLRARADELLNRTNNISSDIHLLSHQLHSSSLEYLGLVSAIEEFCKEMASVRDVEIDFAHNRVPGTLPPNVVLGLFRIVQEALQNAVKHSGVRKFDVLLEGLPGEIQLAVRDGGRGFDPETRITGHSLGLVSMRERVNALNGTISILSAPICGTEITVRIPDRPLTTTSLGMTGTVRDWTEAA